MSEETAKLVYRINSVDFLRGLVMVIMLLDHVRDFIHFDATRFSPTDLSKTNAALFFTRWITHFCAPTFVFLAGTSIYLQMLRGKSRAELSKFLLTRGLWLIFLEFTVIRLSLVFNLDYSFFGFAEVIWIFGVSMIILAALIRLPVSAVGIIGIMLIVFHNLLDGIFVPPATSFAGTPPPTAFQQIWMILHQPGFISLFGNAKAIFVAYPLIPWIGVMAAGFSLGSVYKLESEKRQKLLCGLGLGLILLFIIIRAINVYGDPQIWKTQDSSLFTFLSFLNTTKYPVSLLFLLMTLGPALLILGLIDRIKENIFLSRIFIIFGRVPLFYFILQMFLSHGLAVLLGLLAGKPVGHLFLSPPESFNPALPEAGFDLWIVYASWIFGLIILYPLCVWYGKVKQKNRGFPFSYL